MLNRKLVRTLPPRPRGTQRPKRAPAPPKATRTVPAPSPKFPVYIRATQVDLGTAERDYIRDKLASKFGKYASSVERISVRILDVNGPRGGVDQACRLKIVLRGLPSVVFESRDASLNVAVDAALSGAQRAVRRTVERRTMKPLRRSS
jgi:ribosome-associated translation inhibitor RaiA